MKIGRLLPRLVVRRIVLLVVAIGFVCLLTSPAMAADAGGSDKITNGRLAMIWAVPAVAAVLALVQALFFFKQMMAADEGTKKMIEIAQHVRTGANAYLMQQYKVVGLFFVDNAMRLGMVARELVAGGVCAGAVLAAAVALIVATWSLPPPRHGSVRLLVRILVGVLVAFVVAPISWLVAQLAGELPASLLAEGWLASLLTTPVRPTFEMLALAVVLSIGSSRVRDSDTRVLGTVFA